MRRLALVTVCATLVAGCTVGPDYEEPELLMPDAWQEAATADVAGDAPPLATWWEAFNDPLLTSLIQRAAEGSPNIVAAAARVEEARAIRGVAKAPLFPDLVLGGSYTRSRPSENSDQGAIVEAIGGEPGQVTENFQAGFDSFWEIDLWGRIRRQVESADASLQASVEDYRDALVTLFAEVASAYVDVRTSQERIRFATENVELQTESVQLTRDRFNAGLTSALDVAQAESNLANSSAQIPALEVDLQRAKNRLSVLVGVHPGTLDEELSTPSGVPAPDPAVAAVLPAELLRRRRDVRAAERRLASQTALIGARKAELYPSFSLSGILELVSVDSGDLFTSGSTQWTLVPGLRWNLFAGGRIRSQIRVEEARTTQALAGYEQTVLLALEEAENSLVGLQRTRVRRERLTVAVDATQRAVELVRTQYLSGLTNFQNVLDSQRSLFDQQDQLAVTEGNSVQALIALNKALGGGWDVDAVEAMGASATQQADSVRAGTELPGTNPAGSTPPSGRDAR
jgi:NodT family efflux transporter outer membrane factor (OMF) lipoprotein